MARTTTRDDARVARPRLTRHAQQRSAQRAIRGLQIDLISLFGVDYLQRGGSVLTFIPERTLSELRAAVDRCSGVALIKGKEDVVVTAFHKERNIRHTEYAA